MIKFIFVVAMLFIVITAVTTIWAQEERQEGGSFLSEAISSAANKINKFTSGGDRIFDDSAKGIDKDILEYDGDPLGRPNRKFPYSPRKRNGS